MDPRGRMFQSLVRLRNLGFAPTGILDVGAYEGHFSRGARQIFEKANILMIDALHEKEPILADTCKELGNADHVIAILGEEEKDATPFFVVNAIVNKAMPYRVIKTGSSKFKENSNFPTEERVLPQRTLGSIVADRGNPFELVKIDVQGAELEVLKGLGRHLSMVEVILMEMSLVNYNAGAPLIDTLLCELREMDFVLYDIVEEHRFGGCLFQIDGLFVRPASRFRPQPPFFG